MCEGDSFDPSSIIQHQSELPFVGQISCFFARLGSRCCRIVPGRSGRVRGTLSQRCINSRCIDSQCSGLARIDGLAAANLIHISLIDRRLIRSRFTPCRDPVGASVENPIKSRGGDRFYGLTMVGWRKLRTASKNRRAVPGRGVKGLPAPRRSNNRRNCCMWSAYLR
jgi:hypothetical protein